MKKVLCLSLVTYSIFSMQLDTFKNNYSKIKAIRQKVVKQYSSKLDCVKQHCPKLNDNIDSIDNIKQPIKPASFFASKGLGKIKLFHDEKGFYVLHNDKMHYVQPCFTDSIVRNVTPQRIKDFQKAAKGYLYINQMGDGQFSLAVKERIRGGGPGLGIFMYWATKSICYGIGAVGVATATYATGGAIVGTVGAIAGGTGTATAIAGAGTAIAGSLVEGAIITTAGAAGATATGAVIGSTVGATAIVAGAGTTGAGIVAAGIAGASTLGGATVGGMALTEAAVLTTGAVVSTATSTAGTAGGAALIVSSIEAFATIVGTFFGMLPTP